MLVLDKPSGLLSVPGRGFDKQDCLSLRVQATYPDALVVHRLDMATSGLMLFARGPVAQRALSLAFAERRITKRYVAIVNGHMATPAPDWGVIDLPIGADWHQRPLRKIDHLHGKASVTRWRVLAAGADQRATRLELEPETGRSHQLRVHLLALGHRRFGLLSAPLAGNDRARTRGEGLRAALDEAGLTLDDRCVQYAPIALQAAREAMHKLLALPDPPTAVVATNDVFAVGAMLACREAGVRVPQDISITGVDNTDLGATQTPGLTSVSTPIVDVGHAAADQLVARLEGQPYEAFQVFPADIVHRGTTAPPRVGALRR